MTLLKDYLKTKYKDPEEIEEFLKEYNKFKIKVLSRRLEKKAGILKEDSSGVPNPISEFCLKNWFKKHRFYLIILGAAVAAYLLTFI